LAANPTDFYSTFSAAFDATDPMGSCDGAPVFCKFQSGGRLGGKVTIGKGIPFIANSVQFDGEVELNDNAVATISDSYIGGALDINGTGAHVFKDVTVVGNADLVDTGNLDAKGCKFLGNFAAAAGAGVVTLADSPVLGSITDASNKIVHSRAGVRAGTVTAAGAGDNAIVFATTFGTARYIVTITQEDNGSGVTTAFVKSGTKAATGFTMTVGGAGIFHWKAEVLTQ
jgi:hypothetical protein